MLVTSRLGYDQAGKDRFRRIVNEFDKDLRLYHHEPGGLTQLSPVLHLHGKGYLRALSQLIRQAAQQAMLNGSERITEELLEQLMGSAESEPSNGRIWQACSEQGCTSGCTACALRALDASARPARLSAPILRYSHNLVKNRHARGSSREHAEGAFLCFGKEGPGQRTSLNRRLAAPERAGALRQRRSSCCLWNILEPLELFGEPALPAWLRSAIVRVQSRGGRARVQRRPVMDRQPADWRGGLRSCRYIPRQYA